MISIRRWRAGSPSAKSAGASTTGVWRVCSAELEEVVTDSAYTSAAAALPASQLAFAGIAGRLAPTNHIAGHIQRGGGTGPAKPRQPPERHDGKVPIPDRCVAGLDSSPHRDGEDDEREPAMAVSHLECKECKATYPLEALYVCERCFGPLEAAYRHGEEKGDVGALRRRIQGGPQNIWRYADFLPLQGGPPGPSGRLASRVGLPAGCTPLVRADRLAERLGLREVWGKNDTANPTHSFKDRVVSVAATRARARGFEVIACGSTGNLADAVAAPGAARGRASDGRMPADLEEQKVLATGIYGTHLVAVDGSYDDVNRLCTELCAEREWAFVNVNLRPYYAEGSKTLAFEIAEQLGWELPDRCVVPIASGSLFTKIAKGFDEWRSLGLIAGELPRMNGAQAKGCAPVADAFAAGHDVCRPVKPATIAKSLAIGNPADGPYALDLARRTGGSVDAVDDHESRQGTAPLAQTTGLFTEPARRATTAVPRKLSD